MVKQVATKTRTNIPGVGGRDSRQAARRPAVKREDGARFSRLVSEWKAAKAPVSSVTAMAMLPAYQAIIGMGKPALPLILSQLKQEGDQPDMWFWALKAISQADPVCEDDRGDLTAMAKAWLDWGVQTGVSHG